LNSDAADLDVIDRGVPTSGANTGGEQR
jgi:hypothetical protein